MLATVGQLAELVVKDTKLLHEDNKKSGVEWLEYLDWWDDHQGIICDNPDKQQMYGIDSIVELADRVYLKLYEVDDSLAGLDFLFNDEFLKKLANIDNGKLIMACDDVNGNLFTLNKVVTDSVSTWILLEKE